MNKSLDYVLQILKQIEDAEKSLWYRWTEDKEHLIKIKQELERLEMLEKENQELIINKNFAQGIALKYTKENQDLKYQIEQLIKINNELGKEKNNE